MRIDCRLGLLPLLLIVGGCAIPDPTPESGSIALLQAVMSYKTDLFSLVKEDVLAPSTATLTSADGRSRLSDPRLLSYNKGILVFFNIPPGDRRISDILFTLSRGDESQDITVRFSRDEAEASRVSVGRNEVAYLGSYLISARDGKVELIEMIEDEAGVLEAILVPLKGSRWEWLVKRRLAALKG